MYIAAAVPLLIASFPVVGDFRRLRPLLFLQCRLFLALGDGGIHGVLHEQHEAAQVDDDGGDQIGDLRAVQGLIHIRAAGGDMLDEEGGQDRADGVQAAQEGRRDAVEAHARHGGGTA